MLKPALAANGSTWIRRAWMGVVACLNAAATGYVAYIVFLFTTWPVDDALAAGLSTLGWLGVGARRFAYGAAAALVLAGVLYVVDRVLFAPVDGGRAARRARWLARAAAGVVLLSALAASVIVALRRPAM